jgi:hypothetical protein
MKDRWGHVFPAEIYSLAGKGLAVVRSFLRNSTFSIRCSTFTNNVWSKDQKSSSEHDLKGHKIEPISRT